MNFSLDDYSGRINKPAAAEKLFENINVLCAGIRKERINLMEVCGTHTHEIFKSGIRPRLPEKLKLRSGPGCPVCVTPETYIDGAINLARDKNFIITTFGDMLKVPGSRSSLKTELNAGADVRVVYSPLETLDVAAANPSKNVVFLSVGFETTVPASAFLIQSAVSAGLNNLFIYEANKTVPAAISAIAKHPDVNIDGFILPGHVSVIIGAAAYESAALHGGIPGVVCGFEYIDILLAINSLLKIICSGEGGIGNEYSRAVTAEGNIAAQKAINEVFDPCDSEWRGLGVLPATGLKLKKVYEKYSASLKFAGIINDASKRISGVEIPPPERKFKACRCGEVLLSIIEPPQCPLFSRACNPITPAGPCMVSSEGVCAAYYKYGAGTAGIEL